MALCAPPLLLMVTPGATSVLEEVAPDALVPSVVVPLPVDVVAVALEVLALAVPVEVPDVDEPASGAELVVPACDPLTAESLAPEVVDAPAVEVDDEPDESAFAMPGEVTTITPIPRAAANAPTRPT